MRGCVVVVVVVVAVIGIGVRRLVEPVEGAAGVPAHRGADEPPARRDRDGHEDDDPRDLKVERSQSHPVLGQADDVLSGDLLSRGRVRRC